MSAYDPRRTSDASSTIESRLFMSGAHHRILVFASNVFAAERHTRWQQGLAIARSAAMDKLRCPLLVKSGHFDHKARDIRFAPESGHQTTPPSCRSTALRSSPAVDHNVRIEPLRIENGPQGWTPYGPLLPQQIAMVNDLPSFRTRRLALLQLYDGATPVPSDVAVSSKNVRYCAGRQLAARQ